MEQSIAVINSFKVSILLGIKPKKYAIMTHKNGKPWAMVLYESPVKSDHGYYDGNTLCVPCCGDLDKLKSGEQCSSKVFAGTKEVYPDLNSSENFIALLELIRKHFPITFTKEYVYITGYHYDLVHDCYQESTDFVGDDLIDSLINLIELNLDDMILDREQCINPESFDQMVEDIEAFKIEAQKIEWRYK